MPKEITFTQNARHEATGAFGYNGETKEVNDEAAAVFVSQGYAISTPELEDKTVEGLKADADSLGVDLSGAKTKTEIIAKIREA